MVYWVDPATNEGYSFPTRESSKTAVVDEVVFDHRVVCTIKIIMDISRSFIPMCHGFPM